MKKHFIGIFFIVTSLILTSTACSAGKTETAEPSTETPAAAESSEPKTADDDGSQALYPPDGWVTDIREAYKTAMAEDKSILVDFTGSDWCVWCKKLSAEVFTTEEFKAYADENLVLLFLDFPNTFELPEEQVQHNQILAQMLEVQGYPTIWLLEKDLTPVMVTGYREGGAAEYIRHLKEDMPDIDEEQKASFRDGFTSAIEEYIGALES